MMTWLRSVLAAVLLVSGWGASAQTIPCPYSVDNYYYFIAGDATQVWATARSAFVPVADSSYVSWTTYCTAPTYVDQPSLWRALARRPLVGARVALATNTNVNLAGGGLAAGTVLQSYTLVTGDLVSVQAQITTSQNGIYVVPASGAALRDISIFGSWVDIEGSIIIAQNGTYAGQGVRFIWDGNSLVPGAMGTKNITVSFSPAFYLPDDGSGGFGVATLDVSNKLRVNNIPVPSASTLGGIQSYAKVTNQFIDSISTSGVPGSSQVDFNNLSGSIAAGQVPSSVVTNAKLANMAATTVKANVTGGAAAPADVTAGQLGAILCPPSRSILTSGTDQTYTTPTCNSVVATYLEIELQAGGGGGAGAGTAPGAPTAGGNSCWKASGTACTTPLYVATGGALGSSTNNVFSAGGGTTGCDANSSTGGDGGSASVSANILGGAGGQSFYGGGGNGGIGGGGAGNAARGFGSGGGGAGDGATANSGGGGAAGGNCRKLLISPAASYVYTVGSFGAAGTAGTGGGAGGAGGSGIIVVTARWQ